MSYTIGQAAKAAGVTARAVRLYESKGLLPEAARSPSGYRELTNDDVETLAFIRRGRSLGLSLDAIAEIVAAAADGAPCDRTRALLAQRVDEIDRAVADLQALRSAIVCAIDTPLDETAGQRCALIEAV